ncbi:MAG: polysaccharide deacetylase family protein [Dehalococcoidia bacterium]
MRILLIAVAALVLCACSGGGESTATATPPAAATASATRVPEATSTPTPLPPTATPVPTATSVPQTTSPAVPLIRGPATRKAVVFTFDAGADRGFTEQILETLSKENIKVGFGMTGQWATQNTDLLKRIAAEGHVFINHSYSHASFTGLSTSSRPMTQAERFSELDRTEEVVRAATGKSTKPFFRPPYGDYDASVNTDVGLRGYAYNVLWTVDSRGWMGLSAAEIAQRCLSLAEPGAIYIFHVGSASQDAAALPAVISGLRAQGYEIVPFTDFVPAPR